MLPILTLALQALWLLLPSAAANMGAAISKKLLPAYDAPIDAGATIKGQRILGNNKTWRGVIVGLVAGEAVFLLQQILVAYFPILKAITILDYQTLSYAFGFIFGVGALLGDAVKSFYKRQYKINAGEFWFPFDYIDWILGTYIVLLLFAPLPWTIIVASFVLISILHPLIKYIGYLLKLDVKPF